MIDSFYKSVVTMNIGTARIETRRLTIEMMETLQDTVCSICQSRFAVRQHIVGLSCGHSYNK